MESCTELIPWNFKANNKIKSVYANYVFFHLGQKNFSIDDRNFQLYETDEKYDLNLICKDKILNCFNNRFRLSDCYEKSRFKIYSIWKYGYVDILRKVFHCDGAERIKYFLSIQLFMNFIIFYLF